MIAISLLVPLCLLTQRLVNPATERKHDPYWQLALKEEYKSPEELAAQERREIRRGETILTLRKGDRHRHQVLLTFDDGPHPDFTPKLLKILADNQVKATFFVIGNMAEQFPEQIVAIRNGGHTLGNHTFSHVTLTKIQPQDVQVELRSTNDLIQKISGVRMKYCRPPGGDYDREVLDKASELGLTTVLWTDDPGDYANPGDTVEYRSLMRKLTSGGIILLHDGSKDTLDILDKLIKAVRAKGLKFVSPDEMMAARLGK